MAESSPADLCSTRQFRRHISGRASGRMLLGWFINHEDGFPPFVTLDTLLRELAPSDREEKQNSLDGSMP